MRLTRAGEYAVRCVLYLASQGKGVLCARKDIARKMDIPDPFLGQIAQQLAHSGVILLTVAGLFGIRLFLAKSAFFKAWFASALAIVGATFYGVIGLFPTLFPSSLNPAWSLTAHNAASSQLTLTIMLVVVIIFVPIVLAYQAWAYHRFKSKLTPEELAY